MRISDNLLKYIKEEAENIHHGRIIVELNATSDKIDVITESRERFPRSAEERGVRPTESRNG